MPTRAAGAKHAAYSTCSRLTVLSGTCSRTCTRRGTFSRFRGRSIINPTGVLKIPGWRPARPDRTGIGVDQPLGARWRPNLGNSRSPHQKQRKRPRMNLRLPNTALLPPCRLGTTHPRSKKEERMKSSKTKQGDTNVTSSPTDQADTETMKGTTAPTLQVDPACTTTTTNRPNQNSNGVNTDTYGHYAYRHIAQ